MQNFVVTFTFSIFGPLCKFCPKINLAFWCCLINLPVVLSQRLEASGFPCLLLISINLSDIAILNINSSDYRCIISLIHWFTISVPVLTLPVFRQLLLRNGNISSLFWNEWTQRAESRWLQQSYFTSISKLVLNVFKMVLYFKSIINTNQIKNY